jgi:hypothetical protein
MLDVDCYMGPYQSYVGGALFARRCPDCNRIVKADPTVLVNGFDEVKEEPNAVCAKHGRVLMPFIGYFGDDEMEPAPDPAEAEA